MIKPSNIDFTSPLAALASYEKARFAGYDLEASTEEPVVLEEHDDYTLVGVKLKTATGKDIVRKIKAYKNGESEVVDPEGELPSLKLTGVPVKPIKRNFTVGLDLEPGIEQEIVVGFSEAGLSCEREGDNLEFAIDPEFMGLRSILVTVSSNLGGEESFTADLKILDPMYIVSGVEIVGPTELDLHSEHQYEYVLTPSTAIADEIEWKVDRGGIWVDGKLDANYEGDIEITLTIDGVEAKHVVTVTRPPAEDANENATYDLKFVPNADGTGEPLTILPVGEQFYMVATSPNLDTPQVIRFMSDIYNVTDELGAGLDENFSATLQPNGKVVIPAKLISVDGDYANWHYYLYVEGKSRVTHGGMLSIEGQPLPEPFELIVNGPNTLTVGQTHKYTYEWLPFNAVTGPVTWSVDAGEIDEDGTFYAIEPGRYEITASGKGLTGSVILNVT